MNRGGEIMERKTLLEILAVGGLFALLAWLFVKFVLQNDDM